jgi:hypothetical protein
MIVQRASQPFPVDGNIFCVSKVQTSTITKPSLSERSPDISRHLLE